MKIEIPGLNAQSGLELCGGDQEIYLRSLRLFEKNVSLTLQKMRSVCKDTLHDYYVSVHGIKGMCEYIGAQDLKQTAKQLEEISRNDDLAGVLALNETFIKSTENLIVNIQNWLKENNAY
jgi:HPt (histidine-containing phosphotransfer) domain-containing protein